MSRDHCSCVIGQVHVTGAVPSEHYSQQRRAGYPSYQARVNMFIPSPPRQA